MGKTEEKTVNKGKMWMKLKLQPRKLFLASPTGTVIIY
jgi:hypothetical protein